MNVNPQAEWRFRRLTDSPRRGCSGRSGARLAAAAEAAAAPQRRAPRVRRLTGFGAALSAGLFSSNKAE
jgi:hypothetical protein